MASKPPKLSLDALGSQITAAVETAGELTEAQANQIFGPWRSLTTAIGISGPLYLNHTRTTLTALKRYGG